MNLSDLPDGWKAMGIGGGLFVAGTDSALQRVSDFRYYAGHLRSCQALLDGIDHCDCGYRRKLCGGCKCGSSVCDRQGQGS